MNNRHSYRKIWWGMQKILFNQCDLTDFCEYAGIEEEEWNAFEDDVELLVRSKEQTAEY